MQKSTSTILRQGTVKLIDHLRPLFNEPLFEEQAPVTLLPVEPLFQRQLFLQMAVADHREVFIQLMPATPDGYPVNIRGRLQPLPQDRYLLTTNDNRDYFFTINQLRYIAG